MRTLCGNIASWVVRLRTRLGRPEAADAAQLTDLADTSVLVLAGLQLAAAASSLLNTSTNLYCKLDHPLTKTAIASLGDLMVHVKLVEARLQGCLHPVLTFSLLRQATFRDLLGPVTEVCMKAAQHAQFLVLNLLQQSKRALVSDKKYSDERVDVLSCVLLAERGQLGQPLILTIICLTTQPWPAPPPPGGCVWRGWLCLSAPEAGSASRRRSCGRWGPGCRPVATIKVPLQVLSQLAGLDTLVSIRRRIQASCSTAFLCPLHPAHRDILAVILQGGSCSCCVTVDCADCGLLRRVRHPEGRLAVPCGARRPELRQHAGGRHPPRPRPAAPHAQLCAHRGRGGRGFLLELQTKARKDFTIMEKASTRIFSWLKAPTSTFTFKTLLRHYAKQAETHSK